MKNTGVAMTEPLLSSLMSAVARTGDVAGTEALLQEAAGQFTPNRIHMNCMLDACKHAGDAHSALRIFAEHRDKGLKPDVITFTLLLAVLRRVGRPQEDIKAVVEQMHACGIAPDKFFVEEHLSYTIGMDLPAPPEALKELPLEVLAAGTELLRKTREAGVKLTRMTAELEQRLMQLQTVEATKPEWLRVLCESAEAARPEYFWDRTSGRTQWERPVGHPIMGTVQAAPGSANC